MNLIDLDALGLPVPVRQELQRLGGSMFFTGYSPVGANGETLFGVNVPLLRKVAVKFYRCGAEDRFHAEPQYLAAVESENIVEVLDARALGDDWAVLEMRFCDRGNLDDFLAEGTPSLHTALDMAIGLANGVSALHAASLLHRDLKAENLLVADDGRLLIGDFGSVYRLEQDQVSVVGSGHSILYRPPESFGGGLYSALGDIYQVGVVAYQLLGGHLPYDDDAWIDHAAAKCIEATNNPIDQSLCVDAAIQRRIQRGRLLDYASLPPTVPQRAKRLIRKAARPDPNRRYAGCTDLIRDLTRIRQQSLDWQRIEGGWQARAADRDLRIVARGGEFRAEQDLRRGSGWRRVTGVGDGPAATLVEALKARFGP